MAHVYRVKYKLEPEAGEFTKEECAHTGGGCDALVLVSMINHDDGSYSQQVVTFDGSNGGHELPEAELWKVWAMLAAQLSGSETFRKSNPGKHGLTESVHEAVRAAVLGGD